MAKVKSIIKEGEVVFMTDPDIEFVSLVGHAANQQPFKIIKGQVKGDNNMRKVIHSVLIPKDISEEKMQELSETYKLEEKGEGLDGFDVYGQVNDEEIELETKSVAVIDKEAGVYGIVADLKEESEEEPIEKEVDYATMDNLADAAFAMMDIIFGTLRQPESTDKQRKTMVLNAVENFRKYAEAVLSNAKAEDVATKFEIQGETLKELFAPEPVEPEEDKLEELKTEIETKADEKAKEKIEEFRTEYEEMKTQLNDKLNEELGKFALKEEVETEIKGVRDELENIKNTTTKRKSEIDEHGEPVKKKAAPKRNGYITFA
jgi:2-hydroxychromene-2-carboxylate isomerase